LAASVQQLEKLTADGCALVQARARTTCASVGVGQRGLTRLTSLVWRHSLGAQGLRPPPAQGGGVRHGADPSLTDSVEARLRGLAATLTHHNLCWLNVLLTQGLEDIWRMHRDELALQVRLSGASRVARQRDAAAPRLYRVSWRA
jgi:hypothetical protein